jgi:hypothetical protein
MLINKDREHAHGVQIRFANNESKADGHFDGQIDRITFGASEYQRRPNRENGHADPDGPQVKSTENGGKDAIYLLPKLPLPSCAEKSALRIVLSHALLVLSEFIPPTLDGYTVRQRR